MPVAKLLNCKEEIKDPKHGKKEDRKVIKGKSSAAAYRYCVNIDTKLDKLCSEMDKYWK